MTTPSHNPTLREQLDAVRPDSEDLCDDDLQEAARAVAESGEWRDLFTRQQSFDRQVAAAMQDVVIPDGLASRLLESLSATDASEAAESEPADVSPSAEPPAPVSRRTVFKWLGTAAGLLLAASLGWLVFGPDGSRITLQYARQEVLPGMAQKNIDLSGLAVFDNSFAVALPNAYWNRRTSPVEELKGVDWNEDGKHDGAVYAFQAGDRIRGYLLVIPKSRLIDPPQSEFMGLTGMEYLPVANTAWVDSNSELVYICFVEQGDLQSLQQRLYPLAA